MALDPAVAGELGRYQVKLEKSLTKVVEDLSLTNAQIRLENIEATLLAQLTAAEQAALDPFTQHLNLTELTALRDVLTAQRAALVKAINLIKARLLNG